MKFRKNFTSNEYKQYLANQTKTSKYEHDGLEDWETKEGVKEAMPSRHSEKSKKKYS
jgi:hypothetical protein